MVIGWVKIISEQSDIARLDGQLFIIGFTTGVFEDRIRSTAP